MSAEINNGAGFRGFQEPNSASSDYNAQAFIIWSILRRISTATAVKVMGVAGGFVDILPLVNQIDGAGNSFPHGTIYRCPYWRMQGGISGVIIDPVLGDVGVAIFADRDISSVIANRGQANPGSRRRFDMADAIYFGGILNNDPTQFVKLAADGITIESLTSILLQAPTIDLTASTSVAIVSPVFTHNGVPIGATHKHTGGTLSGLTGVPIP